MNDSPRSSKHSSRTPRSGGESGTGGSARRPAASWVGGTGGKKASGGASASGKGKGTTASGVTASGVKASGGKGTGGKGTGGKGTGAKDSGTAAAARSASRDRAAASAAAAGTGNRAQRILNYPRAGKKNPWRWFPSIRMLLGAFALLVILGVGTLVALYETTDVPEPNQIALAQTSTVYFSDGTTKMGTFSEIDRTILPSDQIPDTVKNAVVASEDSTFYENRGVSPRGIARALWNNLRGGARQGGSTITQQYVERYYTGTDTSYTGKVKEMIMALKIDQELSKDEILSRYLNTIYFGRGAYGVQAASQAYFGKDAKDLTDGEAALLVAVIPAPSAYDPAVDPKTATQRWNRVLEREVNVTGKLTAEQADAIEFPQTQEPKNTNRLGGTNGYLLAMTRSELERNGLSKTEIETGGYKIISTVDPTIQENTIRAIEQLPDDRPAQNHVGTVTIDPTTGAIRAMYGGADYVTQGRSDATQSRMQAGSIFKTFALVAALQDGYSLNSSWDGNSPASFPGWTVKNFNDVSYGTVDLKEATTNSINTAYAELNLDMGPEKTKAAAIQLGLAEDTPGLDDAPSNVLGSASPTVMDMAEAYSTIAAGGVHRTPHIVQQAVKPDGTVAYEAKDDAQQVLETDIATNATVALQGPPSTGSAKYVRQNMDGRPVAGKTGTSESFRSAWFVGFTPQLVTAVGMFQPSEDGTVEEQLTPFGGEDNITGGTFPTRIWVDIMEPSLEGQEMLDFPEQVSARSKKKSSQTSESTRSRSTRSPARTTAPSTEAPTTTEAPATTEAPTTEEPPATEAPTTEAPAEQPTTEAPAEPAPSQKPEQTQAPEQGGGEGTGEGGGADGQG